MADYLKGNVVRITCTFKDINGNVTDPTTVNFKIKKPGAATITYTTPTDVVKVSTGIYRTDVTLDTVGEHFYRWEGVGVADAASESYFEVEGSTV